MKPFSLHIYPDEMLLLQKMFKYFVVGYMETKWINFFHVRKSITQTKLLYRK